MLFFVSDGNCFKKRVSLGDWGKTLRTVTLLQQIKTYRELWKEKCIAALDTAKYYQTLVYKVRAQNVAQHRNLLSWMDQFSNRLIALHMAVVVVVINLDSKFQSKVHLEAELEEDEDEPILLGYYFAITMFGLCALAWLSDHLRFTKETKSMY